MSYIISLVLLLWSFLKRNSKFIFFILIIFMFIMFGWSFGTADWEIHYNKYINYSNLVAKVEPLFYLITKFFNLVGLNFRQFLIIISFIILILYSYIINKKCKNRNFVLALYFIFPFIMEVTQIRFAMSAVVAVVGIMKLCKENCTKKDYIRYGIFILIAGMIHYAALFCFIFILAKKVEINKLIVISVCIIIIISLFIFVVDKIDSITGNSTLINKINFILKLNKDKMWQTVVKVSFRMIIFFVGFVIINRIVMKRIKQRKENYKELQFCNLVLKFNIIALILIPITFYTPDIYRIQQLLSIINYMSYGLYFESNSNNLINNAKIKSNELAFSILCILNAIINLYFLVLSNNNINTVFNAFFRNNILIH